MIELDSSLLNKANSNTFNFKKKKKIVTTEYLCYLKKDYCYSVRIEEIIALKFIIFLRTIRD